MPGKPRLRVVGAPGAWRPPRPPRPTNIQRDWLRRGLERQSGTLPLFDRDGQRVGERTVQSCIAHGWAEPWSDDKGRPDWLICKLTDDGRRMVDG